MIRSTIRTSDKSSSWVGGHWRHLKVVVGGVSALSPSVVKLNDHTATTSKVASFMHVLSSSSSSNSPSCSVGRRCFSSSAIYFSSSVQRAARSTSPRASAVLGLPPPIFDYGSSSWSSSLKQHERMKDGSTYQKKANHPLHQHQSPAPIDGGMPRLKQLVREFHDLCVSKNYRLLLPPPSTPLPSSANSKPNSQSTANPSAHQAMMTTATATAKKRARVAEAEASAAAVGTTDKNRSISSSILPRIQRHFEWHRLATSPVERIERVARITAATATATTTNQENTEEEEDERDEGDAKNVDMDTVWPYALPISAEDILPLLEGLAGVHHIPRTEGLVEALVYALSCVASELNPRQATRCLKALAVLMHDDSSSSSSSTTANANANGSSAADEKIHTAASSAGGTTSFNNSTTAARHEMRHSSRGNNNSTSSVFSSTSAVSSYVYSLDLIATLCDQVVTPCVAVDAAIRPFMGPPQPIHDDFSRHRTSPKESSLSSSPSAAVSSTPAMLRTTLDDFVTQQLSSSSTETAVTDATGAATNVMTDATLIKYFFQDMSLIPDLLESLLRWDGGNLKIQQQQQYASTNGGGFTVSSSSGAGLLGTNAFSSSSSSSSSVQSNHPTLHYCLKQADLDALCRVFLAAVMYNCCRRSSKNFNSPRGVDRRPLAPSASTLLQYHPDKAHHQTTVTVLPSPPPDLERVIEEGVTIPQVHALCKFFYASRLPHGHITYYYPCHAALSTSTSLHDESATDGGNGHGHNKHTHHQQASSYAVAVLDLPRILSAASTNSIKRSPLRTLYRVTQYLRHAQPREAIYPYCCSPLNALAERLSRHWLDHIESIGSAQTQQHSSFLLELPILASHLSIGLGLCARVLDWGKEMESQSEEVAGLSTDLNLTSQKGETSLTKRGKGDTILTMGVERCQRRLLRLSRDILVDVARRSHLVTTDHRKNCVDGGEEDVAGAQHPPPSPRFFVYGLCGNKAGVDNFSEGNIRHNSHSDNKQRRKSRSDTRSSIIHSNSNVERGEIMFLDLFDWRPWADCCRVDDRSNGHPPPSNPSSRRKGPPVAQSMRRDQSRKSKDQEHKQELSTISDVVEVLSVLQAVIQHSDLLPPQQQPKPSPAKTVMKGNGITVESKDSVGGTDDVEGTKIGLTSDEQEQLFCLRIVLVGWLLGRLVIPSVEETLVNDELVDSTEMVNQRELGVLRSAAAAPAQNANLAPTIHNVLLENLLGFNINGSTSNKKRSYHRRPYQNNRTDHKTDNIGNDSKNALLSARLGALLSGLQREGIIHYERLNHHTRTLDVQKKSSSRDGRPPEVEQKKGVIDEERNDRRKKQRFAAAAAEFEFLSLKVSLHGLVPFLPTKTQTVMPNVPQQAVATLSPTIPSRSSSTPAASSSSAVTLSSSSLSSLNAAAVFHSLHRHQQSLVTYIEQDHQRKNHDHSVHRYSSSLPGECCGNSASIQHTPMTVSPQQGEPPVSGSRNNPNFYFYRIPTPEDFRNHCNTDEESHNTTRMTMKMGVTASEGQQGRGWLKKTEAKDGNSCVSIGNNDSDTDTDMYPTMDQRKDLVEILRSGSKWWAFVARGSGIR